MADGIIKIEIGGGFVPVHKGTVNLDPVYGFGEWRRKAQEVPWPVEDDSIEYIRASHVMEHIPAGEDRIAVMNEAWRVLKPGGTFEILVPFIENPTGRMSQAIADPTHVSYWCQESFAYFDMTHPCNADYGILPWITLELGTSENADWEGHWIGEPNAKGGKVFNPFGRKLQQWQEIVIEGGEIVRSEIVRADDD